MLLIAETVKTAVGGLPGTAPGGKSKVLTGITVPYGGRQRPVVEVIAGCRTAVAQDPKRLTDWLRLAWCYQTALRRPRFALRYTGRALALDSHAVEAVLLQAHALSESGDPTQALDLLRQALAAREHWRFFLSDLAPPAKLAAQFAGLYNDLLRRLGRLGHRDRPALAADFFGSTRKVGRNDPCPCGSGKKFKKCCMAGG